MSLHWLLAVPLFTWAAWYLRRSPRPVAAGAVAIGAAVFLGQMLEPLGEIVLYGDPFADVFAPARLGAFAAFLAAGVVTYALVTWWSRRTVATAVILLLLSTPASAQLRVALAKQPFSPNGVSAGPTTMANGGIQPLLAAAGVMVRLDEAALTAEENSEYGGWKRLGMALGHYADIVARNAREG